MKANERDPFILSAFHSFSWETQLRINSSLDDCDCNPWIWRENQRWALIGFSYSEIRFLNKNIVKCLNLNAIFRESIYFFQFFFLFCSITYNTNLHFCGLCMLSSIKCTSENTKYKRIYFAPCGGIFID